MSEVTRLLQAIDRGDRQAAEQLLPVVYDELRRLAAAKLAQEAPGQTLEATALVHEAYLRLVGPDGNGAAARFEGRGHFFGAAAEAMRRILVDNARRKRTVKHGGHLARRPLDAVAPPAPPLRHDLLALDEALTELAVKDQAKADLVKLRYFAGLTLEEAARALGISPATADRWWAYARAWLHQKVTSGTSES